MAWVRFRKKDMPGGLWTKCPSCEEMIFSKELSENFHVCPKCAHHMTCTVDDRVRYTLDK
jgi:acetyl-CoA carboxylase carboxyl transferase subunit beta